MESLPLRVNGGSLSTCYSPPHSSFSSSRSSTICFNLGLPRNHISSLTNFGTRRINGHVFRVLANPNVSPGKGNPKGEIIMVDPLEAKRLAAKQMQDLKAREKLELFFFALAFTISLPLRMGTQRQRKIEAINGAWAMIGLTAGLVIEGQTGNSIPTQLAGYWSSIFSQLDIEAPSSDQLAGYWNKVMSFFPQW